MVRKLSMNELTLTFAIIFQKKMRLLITCFVILFSINVSFSQTDINSLLTDGRALDAGAHEEEALQKFVAALKIDPDNYEANWQTSFLFSRIGNRQTDEEKKKQYFITAKVYAQKALKLNPTDAESNFVMAVAMGRMA